MAFSFGTTPAAAPSAAPTFGAPSPATAGGLFGAPAPAPTGSLFGAPAPAPSGGLFGSTTAPAPAAGGLFGAAPTTAPAPSGGLFGSVPAPSGGLFGSVPAPAPSGGLFGSTAPAPSGGLFGGTSQAPSGGLFGAPAPSAFGAPAQAQHHQQYIAPLSGNTPYSQLPPNLKNAIDEIYRHMMAHRRTLASVKTMAPSLLECSSNDINNTQSSQEAAGADIAAGSPTKKAKTSNLAQQLTELHKEIEQVAKETKENIDTSGQLKTCAGEVVTMAKLHGLWPIETIAARRQVILSSLRQRVENSTKTNSAQQQGDAKSSNLSSMPEIDALALQNIMDVRAASVDRKEQIPSPYYWEILRDLEKRARNVATNVEGMASRLANAEDTERSGIKMGECNPSLILCDEGATSFPARCAKLARIQNEQFLHIANGAARLHEEMELLKTRHKRLMETQKGIGQYDDPFFKADVEEMRKERELQQRIIEERLLANAGTAPSVPAGTPATLVPSGSLFGSTTAPAPSGGLFGSTAPAPAGGLFGSTTPTAAPTPASGGLFGTPAAAPAGGGLFGSTPASSTGPAPAPSTGSGLFGSTPAPASAAPASAAPSSGLFGAPAPAPTGGLFGAPAAAAPAGGGLFAAPTTPASTLAPRKKPSGSRSGGRRR